MQDVTTDLTRELLKEKRSDRRWRNIRFFSLFILIVVIIVLANSGSDEGKGGGALHKSPYVALLRLDGTIEAGNDFSAEEVVPRLHEAFTDSQAKGVVLVINSGGGTPVQSSIIHDAIVMLKKKYHKKVVVVGEDLLASGAYYVAVSADKIYVNPNTITGSIGVIMKGFGFPDVLKKVGVERRVYTAGANKDRLDPFLPQTKEDIEKIKSIIGEIHQNFEQIVLEGRKDKLHADPSVLFSGDFWSGEKALQLGLVDGLGNLSDVMEKEFNVSHFKDYGSSRAIWKSIVNQLTTSMSMALTDNQVKVLEKI